MGSADVQVLYALKFQQGGDVPDGVGLRAVGRTEYQSSQPLKAG